MKYVSIIFFAFLVSFPDSGFSQQDPLEIVTNLFDGMREIDSLKIARCFHPKARLMSVGENKNGKPIVHETAIDRFVQMAGSPHEDLFDEQLYEVNMFQDGRLATVWAPYTFYINDSISHCGTNAFQLFFDDQSWKILQITDTRNRTGCPEAPSKLIHRLMDNWHKAAAEADEKVFFGSMTEDGIYLGTDESERWLRDDMREWSAPYFAKESAWAFSPYDREIYFSENGKTAWFEEKLDTWMGPCRGSGTLSFTEEGWKIRHYNLAVLVPNDKIDGFLELIGKEKRK